MDTDLIILSTRDLCDFPQNHHLDDRLLLKELMAEGLRVKILPWEDEIRERPLGFLFRTVWGYYKQVAEFKQFLQELDRGPWMVWNPVHSLRWNLHKKYLLELKRAGHPVVPTKIIPAGSRIDPLQLWEEFESESIVIKPAISASAHLTLKVGIEDQAEQVSKELDQLSNQEKLVQSYIPSIAQEGEYSLIFIENDFSHCILKTPAEGDFRVQAEYGGRTRLVSPPPKALQVAQDIVDSLKEENLYARVDLVRIRSDQFLLMELELIEPELFFQLQPSAATRLAQALSKRL